MHTAVLRVIVSFSREVREGAQNTWQTKHKDANISR